MKQSLGLCVLIAVLLAHSVLCFAGEAAERPRTSGPVLAGAEGVGHRYLSPDGLQKPSAVLTGESTVRVAVASFPGIPVLRRVHQLLNDISSVLHVSVARDISDCGSWALIKLCFDDTIPDEDKPECCFGHDSSKPDDE